MWKGCLLTSTSRNLRICLPEQNHLVNFHILEVIPFVSRAVVQSFVFVEFIVIYHICRNSIDAVIDSTSVAECERPVITRSLERLPDTVIVSVKAT